MKLVLGLILQYAAISALVGGALSVVTAAGVLALRRTLVLRPALRADLQLLLASLPFAGASAAIAATAFPSLWALALGQPDHCAGHGHHLHLCVVHPAAPPPALAAFGAVVLAIFVFRATRWGSAILSTRAHLRELEALAVPVRGGVFPVYEVAVEAALCHAAGSFRRRVIISSSLSKLLSAEELRCALLHEEAHLHRRDPLARAALSFFNLFGLPFLGPVALAAFAESCEEAADVEAAARSGAPLVASALVTVAASSRRPLQAAAFGEHSIERRVRLLLGTARPAARGAGPFLTPAAAAALIASALVTAETLHHAAETALHLLF